MLAVAVPAVSFRAEDHTYWREGKRIPNVTSVLSLLQNFDHIDPAVLANAQQEGIDIHRMCDLYWKRDLDEDTLPEWLRPRLAALKRFEGDTGFQMLASETIVYHPAHRYAGMADLIGRMRMPELRAAREVVACVDVKRSFLAGRVIGLQLAAYSEAWNASEPQHVTHRFALQLRADGTYRLEPFRKANDLAHFIACLLLYRFKEESHD